MIRTDISTCCYGQSKRMWYLATGETSPFVDHASTTTRDQEQSWGYNRGSTSAVCTADRPTNPAELGAEAGCMPTFVSYGFPFPPSKPKLCIQENINIQFLAKEHSSLYFPFLSIDFSFLTLPALALWLFLSSNR